MRLSSVFFSAVVLSTIAAGAAQACAPESLGTHRTIRLDPAKTHAVVGLEKSLGLKHKEVVLTFDDGPIAGRTSAVLKALEDECVKATFFYVGKMAKAYPRLVRKVVSKGHTLAHHTWSHERLPKYKIEAAAKAIEKGMSTVEKIAYGSYDGTPRVPFMRYPYLASNAAVRNYVRKRGLISFDANIDSRDWKKVSADAVHDRIMKRLKQDGRGIVLMHDIQTRTAKMLPRLLRSMKDEGYRIVHVVPATRGKKPVEPMVVASLEPSIVAAPLPKARKRQAPDPVVTAATRVLESYRSDTVPAAKPKFANVTVAKIRATPPPVPLNSSVSISRDLATERENQLLTRSVSPSFITLRDRPVERIVLGEPPKPAPAIARQSRQRRVASLAASWKLRSTNWILR